MSRKLTAGRYEMVPLDELVPYDGNAKKHTNEQIDAVKKSMDQLGFGAPLVCWHNDDGRPEIVAGHARAIAAKQLGIEKVPVVFRDDWTDAQRRAYTLADNQTTMMTGWDEDQLAYELDTLSDEFDMSDFGFDLNPDSDDETYTSKISGLLYEPSGEKPELADLLDDDDYREMAKVAEAPGIPDSLRPFLLAAATRFHRFDYAAIADYYAQADARVQDAFEHLKLVIVDKGGVLAEAAAKFGGATRDA